MPWQKAWVKFLKFDSTKKMWVKMWSWKKNQKWEKADQLSCLICREQHKGTWDNVTLLFTEFTFFTPLEGGSGHFYSEESSGIGFLAMVSRLQVHREVCSSNKLVFFYLDVQVSKISEHRVESILLYNWSSGAKTGILINYHMTLNY